MISQSIELTATPIAKVGKIFGFMMAAIMATFGLFVIMDKLVESDNTFQPKIGETILVDIGKVAEEKPIVKKPLPTPPVKPITPPRTKPTLVNDEPSQQVGFEKPSFDIGLQGQTKLGLTAPQNTDASPLVRIEPRYPPVAARDGVEGWVRLSFNVNEMGKVTDIQIVDAKPKKMFNKEAKRALKKWKYKPKLVDGKPVKQPNQTIVLEFNLQQS